MKLKKKIKKNQQFAELQELTSKRLTYFYTGDGMHKWEYTETLRTYIES